LSLPPALLAATLYAEMNSRWLKDDFEDECAAAVGRCMDGCGWPDSWLADIGRGFIANDQSFGPAKMKPGAILDTQITVPSLLQAGVAVPTDRTEAAIQSLDFERSAQFAAGYLKGLADLRKADLPGSAASRATDMLKVDMQVVRVAYNEGLKGFIDLGEGTLGFYQTTTTIKAGGIGAEISPWLDAFALIYGP
jgi:hypothetical protein